RRSEASRAEGSAPQRSAPAVQGDETVAVETGAHERPAFVQRHPGSWPRTTAGTEESGPESRVDFDARVAQRLQAQREALARRAVVLEPQVVARVDAVRGW